MTKLEKLKDNAFQSAVYDTFLQVFLRMISFILNAFIVRHISSSVFAVMTVRLQLLYGTGLLLSREAFRRAALGSKSSVDIKKIVNLIWIGAAVSIPVTGIGWVVWCHLMEVPSSDVTLHYHAGVVLILLSIVTEVCTESPYIMAELHLWAKVKVVIEGAMQLTHAVLLALGVYLWPDKAVLIYGISKLTGSIIYCLAYYGTFARELQEKDKARKLLFGNFRSLFVTFTDKIMYPEIDGELWRVSVSFLKQGLLKEALTEGEFYLMNLLPLISLSQQGIYQVVSNLGSLAARLVFRSTEAASYKFFVQSLKRGSLIKDQDKNTMTSVSHVLHTLLKNMTLLSLFILTFGWAYSDALLLMYGGSALSSSGFGLLRAQCIYVVFLAMNGILESFTFATMSDMQLQSHNKTLLLFSAAYILLTGICVNFFGVYGFVIGNCANMLLRIIHGLSYIRRLFSGSELDPLKAFNPTRRICFTFLIAFVLTALSEMFVYPNSFLGHLVIGLIVGFMAIFSLREDLKDVILTVFTLLDKLYVKYFHTEEKSPYSFAVLNVLFKLLFT